MLKLIGESYTLNGNVCKFMMSEHGNAQSVRSYSDFKDLKTNISSFVTAEQSSPMWGSENQPTISITCWTEGSKFEFYCTLLDTKIISE